jgi:hypothetical protein
MKIDIDKSIKKSLEGHELPYDTKAWEAMNKRLDQTMPNSSGSMWKWFLGGAAVVGVVVTTITLMQSGDHQEKASKNTKETVQGEQGTEAASSASGAETVFNQTQSGKNAPGAQEANGSIADNNKNETGNEPSATQNNDVAQQNDQNNGTQQNNNTSQGPVQKQNSQQNDPSTDRIKEVILPRVDNVCQGENIKIDNRVNDVALYLIDPNGNKSIVKAGSIYTAEATEDGTYFIAHIADGKTIDKESLLVLSSPNADIDYDRNILYSEGIPTTSLSTNSVGSNFEWSFPSIQQKTYGKTADAHFFKDGLHEVILTVTGPNGCKATETAKVEIENNYNLLAESGFNPNSTIAVNRAFMPDALAIRNTPFTLYIIEPSTGAVIYETNDAAQPWTGVDKRNGQVVEFNSTYIWKVVLKNPFEGEKANYAGTIVLSAD